MLLRLILWGLLIYFAVKLIQTVIVSLGRKRFDQPPVSGKKGTDPHRTRTVDIPQNCIRDADFEDIEEKQNAH